MTALVLRCGAGGELAANLRPPVTVLYPPCPNQMKAADMIQLSVKKRASGEADTRLGDTQQRTLPSRQIETPGHRVGCHNSHTTEHKITLYCKLRCGISSISSSTPA